MNEIVRKSLLAGDKFMFKIHLRQPEFTYSTCGPFRKNKERIQKFKETGDLQNIYKFFFLYGMIYGDFNDLTRRTPSDKVLHYKAFNIAKNPKYDWYQRVLASMVYKFFLTQGTSGGAVKIDVKPESFELSYARIRWSITQTNY